MAEEWITLPSGAHVTDHADGVIVQRVSDSARIVQAVFLTWGDLTTLTALKARRERRALLPEGWEVSV